MNSYGFFTQSTAINVFDYHIQWANKAAIASCCQASLVRWAVLRKEHMLALLAEHKVKGQAETQRAELLQVCNFCPMLMVESTNHLHCKHSQPMVFS